MQPKELVEQIGARARVAATRHDYAKWMPGQPKLPSIATEDEIRLTEHELGFTLPEFFKVLLSRVANGGFGPGYGIIGVGKGYEDFGNGNLVSVYRLAHSSGLNRRFLIEPDRVVPICNWGCGIYSCLDCRSASDAEVLLCNPKIDFFSSDNLQSVEIRDPVGNIRHQRKLSRREKAPEIQRVLPARHRRSLVDLMTAWVNGESLWDEIEKLSSPPGIN